MYVFFGPEILNFSTIPMTTITLTTDFGERDYFVGAVKGCIYSQLPGARIVDISHSVSPFNHAEAAYIICNAYKYFPKGTIHIIGVDTESFTDKPHLLVVFDKHYFLSADNGILSLLTAEAQPEAVIALQHKLSVTSKFPTLDVFVDVAVALSQQTAPEKLGRPIDHISLMKQYAPVVKLEQKQIVGSVIYVDNYGNVVSNITQDLFESIGQNRSFEIYARGVKFNRLFTKYSGSTTASDISLLSGDKMALFNSAGFLQLSIYKSNPQSHGGAASLFGLKYSDSLIVTFTD